MSYSVVSGVLMAVPMEMAVIWDVSPYSLIDNVATFRRNLSGFSEKSVSVCQAARRHIFQLTSAWKFSSSSHMTSGATHAALVWNSFLEQADHLKWWNVADTMGAMTLPVTASWMQSLPAARSPSWVRPNLRITRKSDAKLIITQLIHQQIHIY